jgi:outer membrane receptor for ferrienterochelin and colicin
MTGTIRGTVKVVDAGALPGVLVTLESPAIQGKRTQSTGANGDYLFKFLPPGSYTVSFELSGMKKTVLKTDLDLGATVLLDATLQLASQVAAVTVTGGEATVEQQTAVHGATYDAETVAALPVGRNIQAIASLSPGLTTRTVNAGQLQISGGFAYDNKFLVDGVDINDNLFGTATNALVIEDAVQETQILTSGISAEYGGFSGGIVNAITKSGGNQYHGTFRTDFTNDNWTKTNPFEDTNGVKHPSVLNEVYSGTLGGKIIQDRLWFFGAGRYFKTDNQITLPVTAESFVQNDKQYRFEAKLTGNINDSHTLQATYNQSDENVNRVAFAGSSIQTIDTASIENPKFPTSLFVANYHGVLTPTLFATLQYSEKKFQFKGSGGSNTNLAIGSPFFSFANGPIQSYHAPYFDATDPEDRNNREYSGSLSYFLTTSNLGSHDMKLGVDRYESIRTGGNSQSPTNYVFYAEYKQDANGKPVYDATGQLIPVFANGSVQLAQYVASRGAQQNLKTTAIYFNDSWKVTPKLSANIGFRYEKVKGDTSYGATLTDTSAFVPRLGIAYDVKGDGSYRVSGTYAQYAGKYNDSQFGQNSSVGNPYELYYQYNGPDGEGNNFAPAFDLKNYSIVGGYFPTQNVFFENGLSSPITTEITLSAGAKIGRNGSAAITYVNRRTKHFVEDFIDTTTGKTDVVIGGVDYGLYDNHIYRNSDGPQRKYEALEFQGRYNVSAKVQTQLNYTYMIRFFGNFEGEASNQPGISSIYGDYPEIVALSRQDPTGNLSGFERHKLRWITNINIPAKKFGMFSLGTIFNFDSGAPYSLSVANFPYSAIQLGHDPGYSSTPPNGDRMTLYFGDRGSQTFGSQSRLDLALMWEVPVYKELAPYVRFACTNVLNSHQHTYNVAIRANNGANDPKDANGLPTTYTPRATFGTVTSSTQYMQPLSFNISAGIKF